MVYRHSEILTAVTQFVKNYDRVRQASTVHTTADGCAVVLHDDMKNVGYLLQLSVLKPATEITPNGIIEKGGFHG